MDSSALESAETWLSVIGTIKLLAALLVAVGVAMEFGGEWISRPFEKTVEDTRKLQIAQLSANASRLSAEAETAKSEIAKANAAAAEATERAARVQADNTQLEIRLEEERKSKIALQKALETPHLTPEQMDGLTAAVRGRVPFLRLQYTSDATSLPLAQDIKTAFERANVTVNTTSAAIMSPKLYGLFITIPTEEFRFLPDLFKEFGFAPQVTVGPATQGPTITVGEKKPPF